MSSALDPASPNALVIANLFWLLHGLATLICLGVFGATVWFALRFRARTPVEPDAPIYGNTRLELAWTAAPALLLIIIFELTVWVMVITDVGHTTAAAGLEGPVMVRVTGHQFWWEFRLPEHGVVTANEVHLPVGRPALFEVTSADVIHSFWLPQMHGKSDGIPGRFNRLAFTPQRQGMFQGFCAEFCGMQHAWMLFRAFVGPPEEFAGWVRQQQQDAAEPSGAPERRGSEVFQANTCVNCHTIRGTGATGKAGPDLTHIGSRTTLGAGVADNTPDNLAQFLRNPQQLKPGALMPGSQLTDEDLAALAAYLTSLK